jgi:hypothetical protein
MKDKSQILEKAYFISGAQTKLISSKIVLWLFICIVYAHLFY